MFPSNAAYRGPSNSFLINQDRQGISSDLIKIYSGINSVPTLINPNEIDIPVPGLSSSTLAIGLPSVSAVQAGGAGITAKTVLALQPYSDTYVYIGISGDTNRNDFDPTQTALQTIGTYTSYYLVVPTTLKTLYPVNISLGSLFWEDYQGVFPSVNGGWGPGLLASDGTGYAIRVAGGQGGLFRTLNGVAYGNALVLLGQNSCNDGNQHHFKLGVQYLGLGTSANTFSYHISIYLDANSIPSATYTDTVSTLDPTQVYPSFISDGGNVFLYNWTWYNDDNTPVIGWKVISVRYGDAKPSTIQTASPVFLITSTTTPIAIQPLFVQQRADNRIARMRSNLNLLQRAYF